MIVKKFDGIGYRVLDVHSLNGVIGVGNVDLQFAVMTYAARIEPQGVTIRIGDALHTEEKGIVQALWSYIFNGNRAIDSVPRAADEMCFDFLGNIDSPVTCDRYMVIETFDAQLLRSAAACR